MTSFDHLTLSGSVHHLVQHLGNPETTIVAGERYVTREPGVPAKERMAPDLLIAFNADPEAYRDDNGYIISAQGKPPDFVMEIASRRTGRRDVVQKRARYALDWLIERYQVRTKTKSRVPDDPNGWATEQRNPQYIIDLIKRITTVSGRTVVTMQGLPQLPI